MIIDVNRSVSQAFLCVNQSKKNKKPLPLATQRHLETFFETRITTENASIFIFTQIQSGVRRIFMVPEFVYKKKESITDYY